jgi:hypothetical protein
MKSLRAAQVLAAVLWLMLSPQALHAQQPAPSAPTSPPAPILPDPVAEALRGGPESWTSPERLSSTLQVMLLLTVLSLAPAILLMTTSFVRIVVVLGLLRQAIGTQQLPPSQVMTTLALFMTLLVMGPTWNEIYTKSIGPYSRGQIIEQFAASKVARLREPDTLDAIVRTQDAMEKVLAAGDVARYYDLNDEFHGAIVSGANNATLAQMHHNIMLHVRRARHRVHEYEPAHKTSFERHNAVIRCVLAGDEDGAGKAARAHLEDVANAVLSKIRSASTT